MIKKQGLLLKFEKKFNELKEKGPQQCVSDRIDSSAEDIHNIQSSSAESLPSDSQSVRPVMSTSVVKDQSKIYGRNKENTKLSSWQKAVNNASFLIVGESPDMLYNRAQLKLAAEEEARKTYVFKKKSGSRSRFERENDIPKRKKMSTSERKEELISCSSKIQVMNPRITELKRNITEAKEIKDYGLCAKLHDEQRKMIRDVHALKKKHSKLQKKEIKHQKYIDKRKDNSKSEEFSSDDSEDVLPQRDIRSFLQKGEDELGFSSTSSKMHGPQSDDRYCNTLYQ